MLYRSEFGSPLNFLLKFLLLILVVVSLLLATLLEWGGTYFEFPRSLIVWGAVLWFTLLVVTSFFSEKMYWMLAPFVIIFTPNAINDLWPSIPMAASENSPTFSFFTHIDIYLLMGVIGYCDFNRKQSLGRIFILFCVVIVALTAFVVSVCNGFGWQVAFGSYQIRYLLWLLLLFSYANPLVYEKDFSTSFVIVLLLVIFEASVFSFINGEVRFTSGNYGVNSFGHLLAAGVVFVLNRDKFIWGRVGNYFTAIVLLIALLATATRFSLVALFCATVAINVMSKCKSFGLIFGMLCLLVGGLVFINVVPAGISLWEGLRVIVADYSNPENILVTPESSSMVTRIKIWFSTSEIIFDHPWLGIGPAVWPFVSDKYGLPFSSVLDPHQDFLNYIVSYGLFIGSAFFFCIFIYPILVLRKIDINSANAPWPWFGIILVFIISGLTNAVTWKHQLAALTYYSTLLVSFNHLKLKDYNDQED